MMKRDMELVRLILLKIEDEYRSTAINNLTIDGYDTETVAYHCKIMHEANLISGYKAFRADNRVYGFGVSGLTWEGCDFLDKIRDNTWWGKTKSVIHEKGLPLIIDTIKTVSSTLISAATEGAVKAYLEKGGQ